MDEQLYFNIRSKECTQVTNNADLIVNLPFSIDIADNEWLQVEVISAEIPNSFYNISTALQNNIFSYTKSPGAVAVNLTIPSGNYTRATLATELQTLLNASIKKFYAGLSTAKKFIWVFSCTYDLNTNTFNISSKLTESNLDARNSWSILTDTTMNTLTGWTGPAYDKNNLHSFNANIQNNTANSLTFAGWAAETGFICDFLDLHSNKNINLFSIMANYDSINPEGYPSNIIKRYHSQVITII
jgi:hypothetical protein